MDRTFGSRLRVQREQRQIALATIAGQTKINLSLLEGLERDDMSRWPAGVFRRSYVRAYARAIGLEPEAVIREFIQAYPDSADGTLGETLISGGDSAGHRPPTRLQYLVGSAIGALPGAHRLRRQPRDLPPASVSPALASASVPPVVAASAVEPDALGLERDLSAVAHLCSRLARVVDAREVTPVLEEAARIVGAVGMILWIWDPRHLALTPLLSHGYSDDVLAQLPPVGRDTDNAIATAFRSAEACVVDGSDQATGAVAIPVTTAAGCLGVLAFELRHRAERRESVRAFATILAAQLATLVGSPPAASSAEAVSA